MEVDEQDREQVDSERESRGARERGRRQSKETNAQTCDDMCMSDFVRHTLRHLEPQRDVCTRSNMSEVYLSAKATICVSERRRLHLLWFSMA